MTYAKGGERRGQKGKISKRISEHEAQSVLVKRNSLAGSGTPVSRALSRSFLVRGSLEGAGTMDDKRKS